MLPVRVISHPQLTSGFVYEDPLPTLPMITHCGEAVTTTRHHMSTHQHTGFEFMYVCRGAYTWAAGGSDHRQRVGDLFVSFPRQPHATAPVPHPVCHHLWLGVELDEMADGAQLARCLRDRGQQLIRGCTEVEPLMRGLVLQSVGSGSGREAVASAYLATLVQLLLQYVRRDPTQTGEAVGLRYSYPVLKAVHLMRENLAERIPLTDLAKAAGIGVSQLCRRFRLEVGQSPAEHHRRLRLDIAKERLLAPDASIADTAHSCGFSSAQHLSRLFRENYGLTPGEWMRASGRGQPE